MKNLIFASLLLFPLLSNSQVKTGGGTVLRLDGKEEYGKGGGRSGTTVMSDYIKHLKRREMMCGDKERKHFRTDDFMTAYFSLSVYTVLYSHNGPKPQVECNQADAFLRCINDDTAKALYKEFSKDPEVISYLKVKYDISEEEAKKMVKFFESFGERIK